MMEKIERINRVKGIDNRVDKHFNRRTGYEDNRRDFSQNLEKAIKRQEVAAEVQLSTESVAAFLELQNTATHSLFYQSGLTLNQLLGVE